MWEVLRDATGVGVPEELVTRRQGGMACMRQRSWQWLWEEALREASGADVSEELVANKGCGLHAATDLTVVVEVLRE